ncbi:hypothetical protein LX16_4577 [Stackebrandtia albiflava]|uniref:ARB-07466-like C-terminal domain-containing protein n=1 Tax=Stackebrandtia albiflava TaxID=406432 RepID=A0A562URV9_9ACTN|nr:hypothetical protein LX16_4577 [Stackebrandtia albiflava]
MLIAAAGACSLLFSVGTAAADPSEEQGIDSELSQAIDDYIAAESELNAAEERQDEIKDEIVRTKEDIERLTVQVNEFAVAAYLNGGIPSAVSVLATGDPASAVDGLTTVSYLGDQSGQHLQDLVDAKEDLAAEEVALEDEVIAAENALADMKAARDAAARAVAAEGGGTSAGPTGSDAPAPEPAPRNTDGSFPYESCSVDDPTTGGCITPRMDHALTQAILVGFDRYTKCYRSAEDGGEHPRGRACDFSAAVGGFHGYAVGGDKAYGDALAGWFVEYGSELGVKYVIWFNMIWEPALGGWREYPGCGGTSPSCDHTDHVHVSMV